MKNIIFIIAITVLPSTICLYAQPDSADSVKKYLELSTSAYGVQNYQDFYRFTKKLVEIDPDNYLYRYNLACAAALSDREAQAIEILNFLLDHNDDLVLMATHDGDFDRIRTIEGFQDIEHRIRDRTRPLEKSRVAFTIPEKDLIPEGITYDPVDRCFYLGSLQKFKIIKIDAGGNISDFRVSRQDGLVPVLGMKVDAGRRILWVVTSYGFQRAGLPSGLLGTSGVFKYDLVEKKLLKKYMLPPKERHFLNDLTLDSTGTVYVTDWAKPAIYYISAGEDEIKKFCDLPRSPNGIDISPDGKKLFVAGSGIGVLDILSKRFTEFPHPPGSLLSGDGLYYYKNSLIAVQNADLGKISRFYLDENQEKIVAKQLLEAYHPLFDIPTTGVIVENLFFFIANSQLRSYDERGNLFPLEKLKETKILQIELEDRKDK
ncbi:SMP-30/gluconolactonase/LRE family protein [candidate division KSB1 bacterium]|nr:SMP-30/gluconolactonase/LRE family protein [candidate division KSB1 bacterium]